MHTPSLLQSNSETRIYIVFGLLLGFADYSINRYIRLPVVELLIAGVGAIALADLSERQILAVIGLPLSILIARAFVDPMGDALMSSWKVFLLIFNMVFSFNSSRKREAILYFYFGCAISFLLAGLFKLQTEEADQAKYIIPNAIPIAMYLISTKNGVIRHATLAGASILILQLGMDVITEFRSHIIIFIASAIFILAPRKLAAVFARNLYLLPIIYAAIAAYVSTQDQSLSEFNTKSNLERSALIQFVLDYTMTFPVFGISSSEFLNGVDITLGQLTNEALSTTSAHNLYADLMIAGGVPLTLIFVLSLRIFCAYSSRVSLTSAQPAILWSAMFGIFMIFSLTPVSAHLRIELLWLTALVSWSTQQERS